MGSPAVSPDEGSCLGHSLASSLVLGRAIVGLAHVLVRMMPMSLLVLVCCGPGAHARWNMPSSSVGMAGTFASRASAGLLQKNGPNEEGVLDKKVYGLPFVGKASTAPIVVEWYGARPSGARSEEPEFDSGMRHSAFGFRLSAFGFRLSAFGDLVTAVRSLLGFAGADRGDQEPQAEQVPHLHDRVIRAFASVASGKDMVKTLTHLPFTIDVDAAGASTSVITMSEPMTAPACPAADEHLTDEPDTVDHALGDCDSLPAPCVSCFSQTAGIKVVSDGLEALTDMLMAGLVMRGTASSRLIGMMLLPVVNGVCIHCKDTIAGCTGGDNCPLFKDWNSNTAIFNDKTLGKTPQVSHGLVPELATVFTRAVVDAIVGLACAPEVGTEINFEDAAYRKSQAVVQAAAYGHCSVAEATSVLAQRLEDATDAIEVSKIKGAMDSLRLVSDTLASSATGVYVFIWTKISTVMDKRGSGVAKIEFNSEKSKAQSLTATLVRPKTETQFLEMTHYFIMVIVGLGIAGYVTVAKFCDDVVWGALRMGESWKVSFELTMVYLKLIDSDTTRTLHLGNAYRRGGQDTLLVEARRNAAAFFRPLGGNR